MGNIVLVFVAFASLSAVFFYSRRLIRKPEKIVGPIESFPESSPERRKLIQAQHEWLDAFDMVDSPAFAYDQSYRIVSANRSYVERAGLPFEEMIGKPYFEIFPKLDHPIIDRLGNKNIAQSEIRLSSGEIYLSKNFPVHDEMRKFRYSIHVLSEITAQRRLEHSVKKTRMMIRMASSCMREMGLAASMQEMLAAACRNAVEAGGYRIAWIGREVRGGSMKTLASHGCALPEEILLRDVPGISPHALHTGKTVIAQDLLHDPAFEPWRKDAVRCGYASMAVLPLSDNKGIFGAFMLGAKEPFAFVEEEISVLEMLASSLVLGIASFRIREDTDTGQTQRIRYLEPLSEHLEDAIEAVASTLEFRINPYATGHLKRVANLALAIGLETGQPEARARGLHLAGLLHDIGEASIPEALFLKKKPLTEAELIEIRRHPEAGYEILKKIDFPWPVAEMVLQHHERLDGSGYPRGLRNGEILKDAQILAVADTIEALAFGQRPNHPRMGIPAALLEVEKQKGKLYDEAVVDAALKLFREKGLVIS